MFYHIVAFFAGVILDLIIGDPLNFPHPVRLIGRFISCLEGVLLAPCLSGERNSNKERRRGGILVILVIFLTVFFTAIIVIGAYIIHPHLGVLAEAVLTCYLLAAKSLYKESMKVMDALRKDGIEGGRYAVSMIVGRDTNALDEEGVIKAAVETVAENTSDGIIAPLIFTFLGGPILGFMYKAVNTMDSMVGYHNEKYENFGFCAAKLDDIVNFIPSRISAVFMIIASFLLGKEYSGNNAIRIFKKDRFNHKSPNSAQTESVCAGALGIRLAGDAYYFGKKVKKPYIGDDIRPVEIFDIKRANRLMLVTETVTVCMMLLLSILVLGLIYQ